MSARTLILTTSYPAWLGDPSGHFVRSEARDLARSSSEILVIAAGRGDPNRNPSCESEPRVEWLGGESLFGFPGALAKLRQNPLRVLRLGPVLVRGWLVLRRHRGDIQAHWLLPFGLLAALSLLTQKSRPNEPEPRFTIMAHGSDVRLLSRAPRIVRSLFVSLLLRTRARLVFVSNELRTELGQGLSRELRSYVNSAEVRPARFELDGVEPSRARAREVVGQSPERRLGVVVGRLIPGKRCEVALEALSLVPDLDTVCVGDGPLRAELMARFPEVRFMGQCERQRALTWIQAADVLVSASRLEGAPTAIREALALGTIAISVEVADLRLWAESEPSLLIVGTAEPGQELREVAGTRSDVELRPQDLVGSKPNGAG